MCIKDTRGTNCYGCHRNRLHPNKIVGRQVPVGWEFAFTVKKGVPNF